MSFPSPSSSSSSSSTLSSIPPSGSFLHFQFNYLTTFAYSHTRIHTRTDVAAVLVKAQQLLHCSYIPATSLSNPLPCREKEWNQICDFLRAAILCCPTGTPSSSKKAKTLTQKQKQPVNASSSSSLSATPSSILYICGSPGTGKTACVESVCQQLLSTPVLSL